VAGAYPSPRPVAHAVAATRRLKAAPDLPSVDGAAAREDETVAAFSSADDSSVARDDVADDDGDGPAPSAPARRTSRLRSRFHFGGVAMTA